jgi:DNA polymerase-1
MAGRPEGGATPSLLSALRSEAAVAAKIDTSAYVAIRDLSTLKAWVADAMETGLVAFDTETTSLDPMQAELVGFSLATRPGHAAYVPLAHKKGQDDLLGGGLVENQIPIREALAAVKPLLEDKSVLKIAQNLKYDLVIMNRYGIDVAPYDDTMLISYALDAGTSGGHAVGEMAWPQDHRLQGRGGLGQELHRLRPGRYRQGDRLCGRRCRRDAEAMAGAETAPRCKGTCLGL